MKPLDAMMQWIDGELLVLRERAEHLQTSMRANGHPTTREPDVLPYQGLTRPLPAACHGATPTMGRDAERLAPAESAGTPDALGDHAKATDQRVLSVGTHPQELTSSFSPHPYRKREAKPMDDLIKALTILRKYGNHYSPTICSHGKLWIAGIDPGAVSGTDAAELDKLGFFVDEEAFVSHRFGSA